MSTVLATVAFLLLLDTSLLSQAGITHYSQLLTLQHSTKVLFVFFIVALFFFKLIFKVLTTTWRVSPGHILINIYKLIIGCQCRQEMGNFTDSEQLKIPKTDCALKVYKDKELCSLYQQHGSGACAVGFYLQDHAYGAWQGLRTVILCNTIVNCLSKENWPNTVDMLVFTFI